MRQCNCVWFSVAFIYTLVVEYSQQQANILSNFNSNEFCRRLEQSLPNRFLEEELQNFIDGESIFLTDLKVQDVLKDYEQQISDIIKRKKEALQILVTETENIVGYTPSNPSLADPSQVAEYCNAMSFVGKDLSQLESVEEFMQKVMTTKSSIQIPVEVYDKDLNVSHTLAWSNNLDTLMKKVKGDLHHQYFASKHGVLRLFPGVQWESGQNRIVDLYDARHRGWYIEGSSSPKDILIMIDTSGSMSGFLMKLTLLAVNKLMESLTENDYIGVAQFPGKKRSDFNQTMHIKETFPHLLSEQADELDQCFETLIQATPRNKRHIARQLSLVKVENQVFIEEALEFAANVFSSFQEGDNSNNRGSNCNNILVVFTDGGFDFQKELNEIKKMNSSFRLFIFVVGQDVNPEYLEPLATCYQGRVFHIPTGAAMSHIITTFMLSLNEFNITGDEEFFLNDGKMGATLHESDPEGFISELDAKRRAGLMVSLTMPVMNRTEGKTLLGVMGTDLSINELLNNIPNEKIQPLGYGFSMNHNGFLLFHPNLAYLRSSFADPPDTDFLDAEWESDEKIELRKAILDSGDGVIIKEVEDLVKVPNSKYSYERKTKYAFRSLSLTNFVLGLAIPSNLMYYANYSKSVVQVFLNGTEDNAFTIAYSDSFSSEFLVPLRGLLNNVSVLLSDRFVWECEWSKRNLSKSAENETIMVVTTEYAHNTGTTKHIDVDRAEWGIVTESLLFRNDTGFLEPATVSIEVDPKPNSLAYLLAQFTPKLDLVLRLLSENITKCKDGAGQHLLLDLVLAQSFFGKTEFNQSVDNDITSIVLSLNSGLTMIYPKEMESRYAKLRNNWEDPLYHRTFAWNDFYMFSTTGSWNEILSVGVPSPSVSPTPATDNSEDSEKMTVSGSEGSTTVIPPYSPPVVETSWEEEKFEVSLFRSITATNSSSSQSYTAGMSGVSMRASFIHSLSFDKIKECKYQTCYLLDDGADIIAVNNLSLSKYVGKSLEEADFTLLKALNQTIYKEKKQYFYLVPCEQKGNSSSSAASFPIPTILLEIYHLSNPMTWIKTAVTVVHHLARTSVTLWFLLSAPVASGQQGKLRNCTRVGYRYYFPKDVMNSKEMEWNGNFTCPLALESSPDSEKQVLEYDIRHFKAQRIDSTNLLLVVVTPAWNSCNNQFQDILEANATRRLCSSSRNPYFRKRPERCLRMEESETVVTCSGAACGLISCSSIQFHIFLVIFHCTLFIILQI